MADKALEDRLKDELIEFIEQEEAVMSFPPSLSSAERRIVHQVRLVLVCLLTLRRLMLPPFHVSYVKSWTSFTSVEGREMRDSLK